VAVDNDYRILHANEAAGGDRVVAQMCYKALHRGSVPCGLAGTECPLDAVLATGEPVTLVHQHHTDEGERTFQISAYPFEDGKSGTAGIVEYWHDVTERELAREALHRQQLMQADKMASLGLMVSGMAHEINNPNNLIMLNAGVIRTLFEAVEQALAKQGVDTVRVEQGSMQRETVLGHVRELADGITGGAQRIARIVQNLRDFARADPGDMSATLDVRQVVDAAVAICRQLRLEATRHFVVEHAESLPEIRGNAQMLEQVIVNLLSNACQALDSKEQSITVRTRLGDEDGTVAIEVIDTGCGIPDENLTRIMDPFFTTRRDLGGTGLGLSVSYGIVEEHGGRLEFESEEAKGTTARVVLPRAEGEGGVRPSANGAFHTSPGCQAWVSRMGDH